jgi:hypothetical protein
MSHCCGGCGGEDPLKKNEKSTEVDEKKTSKDAGKSTATSTEATGTWQPTKK